MLLEITLRKKCPYLELFRSAFSRIRTEDEEILRNNTEYGHFSRNVTINLYFLGIVSTL